MSSSPMAMASMACLNMGTSMPFMISLKVTKPLWSTSRSLKMLFIFPCSSLRSRFFTSMIAASPSPLAICARSTVTARTRFRSPSCTVATDPRKNAIVQGWFSMIGIVAWPQLSPATRACTNVRKEAWTLSKARGHRVQPSKRSGFSRTRFCTRGLMKTTAMMDQMLSHRETTRVPQKIDLIAPSMLDTSRCNSGNHMRTQTDVSIDISRKMRRNVKEGWDESITNFVSSETTSITTRTRSSVFKWSWKNSSRQIAERPRHSTM
mmetsp:Transcript_17374/g.52180  ORF Transcript_17374/g.52180 Transcript_17374/m.52180 type:complete len:264 (-) Transcript_17374:346-1137(-)